MHLWPSRLNSHHRRARRPYYILIHDNGELPSTTAQPAEVDAAK